MKRADAVRNTTRGRILSGLALPLVVAIALVGCGGSDSEPADQPDGAGLGSEIPGEKGVPDVKREPLSEAMETLEDVGYTIQVKGEDIKDFEVPEDPEEWEVIGQNPAAGEEPEDGDLVQLAVRKTGADDSDK